MIVIKSLHTGRFGNKLLHYNNMVQIAKFTGHEWNSAPYEPYTKLGVKNDLNGMINIHAKLDLNQFKNRGGNWKENLKETLRSPEINLSLVPSLGEHFFDFDYNTRDIFTVKNGILDSSFTNIGIHFRGGDFHTWNPKSILDLAYYVNCIDDCLKEYNNVKFYVFTDDQTLKTYKDLLVYLKEKDYNWELGSATRDGSHFTNDFFELADTDVIISSPSTFAICAGFMGKEKVCYHSKNWIDSRVEVNDSFWVNLTKNLNKNYILKKII